MALATSGAAAPMPMPTMGAQIALPAATFNGGGANAPTMQGPTMQSATGMMWEPAAVAEDGVAIGIDLGCDSVRVAIWDAQDGAPRVIAIGGIGADGESIALPSVAVITSSKIEVGCQALSRAVPLVGVQRLLGRKFASLHGAKFIEAEGDELIGCSLSAAEDEDGAPVRLTVTCDRPKPSGLKKRGAAPQAAAAAQKSKTVDRVLSPEELVYKMLLAAKQSAQQAVDEGGGGGEVTHATVAVPSHWGAAQRQAAYDCAVFAGLTPVAIVSSSAAILSLPAHATAAKQLCLLLDWGAGGCSISVSRAGELVACRGDDSVGGLCIDRMVARRLAQHLSSDPTLAAFDLSSDINRAKLLRAADALKLQLFAQDDGKAQGGAAKLSVDLQQNDELVAHEVSLRSDEWQEIAAEALSAVEKLLAAAIAAAAVPPSATLHVFGCGGMSRCAPVRTMLTRALGDPSTFTLSWLDDGSLASSSASGTAAVCGAAIIAAHRLQPAAVEKALGSAWKALPDALPSSIHVTEEGGGSKQILPALTPMGKSCQLSFAPSSSELTVKIVEGSAKGGALLLSPLVDAVVEPSPSASRSVLDVLLGRPRPPPPPQRSVTVTLATTGVIEIDCDSGGGGEDDEAAGGAKAKGLSASAILLLVLLLASSLLGLMPPGSSAPTPAHSSAKHGDAERGAGGGAAGGAEAGGSASADGASA